MTRKDQPRLYNLLENLCISRGIPMPKLKVMDGDALNAFATGLNREAVFDHGDVAGCSPGSTTLKSSRCSAMS